ncbi:MAG TPA: hypothetical protein VJK29_10530 [Terriglobales bacterium]|nr:hypothetical protein [Terriglobales bacterium]
MKTAKDTRQALQHELEFLERGGYRSPIVFRWPLIFEDSPTCPKDPRFACPDADCALMSFVPEECRYETIPCRHIPLNEIGETVDSLYRTGTNEEIEQALRNWLVNTIKRFEGT